MTEKSSPVQQHYDAVIYGGSASGVLAAVRAAREGLNVVLVSVFPHLGGTMTNGLGSWDTQYGGNRAPLVDEWIERIKSHYRDTYGADSEQYRQCQNGPFAGGKWDHLVFEPHVAEQVFEDMLAGEGERITVLRGVEVQSVERAGRTIRSVICVPTSGDGDAYRLSAPTFVDSSYELDLGAAAGVAFHVGRESREEFGEQHAGRLFMHRSGAESDHPVPGQLFKLLYPRDAAAGLLDIRPWWGVTQEIFSQSTGEGDGAVQAYNFRVTLSKDPANRIPIEKPAGYTRERFLPITHQDPPNQKPGRYSIKTDLLINPLKGMPAKLPLPNNKCDWNAAAIPGAVDAYPDGDWEVRHEIMREHREYSMGLLYFLQNDESVPEDVRTDCGQWGLAADEFTDNGNFPYEFYVREARRMRGRKIFTEYDARFDRGLDRSPIHSDSVAMAEWLLDSHDCTTDRMLGSYGDGWTSLSELTRPSQIPYASMLPVELDNLIVSVCVSSTHVGWGTIRVEPVWMQMGEVVGHAVAVAAQTGLSVGELDAEVVQRRLVRGGIMVTFFNFFDVAGSEPWVSAAQFLSTKGFFWSYDTNLDDVLSLEEASAWVSAFTGLVDGDGESAGDVARRLKSVSETAAGPASTVSDVVALLTAESNDRGWGLDVEAAAAGLTGAAELTRGVLCVLLFAALEQARDRALQAA